jgi:formylglycine-generating enzyme required for sulfatase activity
MKAKRGTGGGMNGISKAGMVLAAALAGGAAWAQPVVSGVTLARRAGTPIIDIDFTLSGADAIVTVGFETNGVALPDNAVTALSGDACKVVAPGSRSIAWDTGLDKVTLDTDAAKAVLTVWSVESPPPVLVIHLDSGSSSPSYPVTYHATVESLPAGGLSGFLYRMSRLVMRRITAGQFSMGNPPGVSVTLTRDFYAGIFEVTQRQWALVTGTSTKSNFQHNETQGFRPVEKLTYSDIRGSEANGGWGWPTNSGVYADSFIGRLRGRTGLATLDLPTEAQWEYACRAGTTTVFNDGNTEATVSSPYQNVNPWLDALGRYRYNGGYINSGATAPGTTVPPAYGTPFVGSYTTNRWGLYDMHGGVYERCLNWWQATPQGGVDPTGEPNDGSGVTVKRGGAYSSVADYCTSAYRNQEGATQANTYVGMRLFMTVP